MSTVLWECSGPVEWWLGWMLGMSWQVALLAAAVWILTRLLRRSSASLRYALWLLVFIKLLLPPGLSAPWSPVTFAAGALPAAMEWGGVPAEPSVPQVSFPAPAFSRDSYADSSTGEAASEQEPAQRVAEGMPAPKNVLNVPMALMALWGVVAAGLLLLMTAQWHRHSRRLMRDAQPAPEEISAWGRTQALLLGLRHSVEIYVSPEVKVPCVMGFRKARVFLPRELILRLSPAQQADLIAHEMAHIKRGDLWTGWLASTLVCLYWFHPAVWLANFQLRREREMACDDKVLHATRREGSEYASTMVRVAEGFSGGVPAGAGFLGLFELADNLLQRVRAVSDATRKRRAGWRAAITVVLVALVLIPMGAWTTVSHAQADAASPAVAPASPVEQEIEQHYAKADDEVKEFIRFTARRFGPDGLWVPQDAFAKLTPEERNAKVDEAIKAIESGDPYKALAEAGALGDPRLLPALEQVALDMQEKLQDNRARWMAVAAMGRIGDKKAVPALVPLVDHYNKNVRLWARASLARITGEYFGADKDAWVKWANAAGPETAITPEALEKGSRQSEEKMKPLLEAAEKRNAGQSDNVQAAEKEIAEHYAAAGPEAKEYIKWTAGNFGRGGMWLPEGALDSLTPEQREEKVKYLVEVLNGEYGRHLCGALAEAGVLKDARLLPGLTKQAGYHRDDSDYDCRPKWIAVASLGRQDDPTSAPLLVDLVDHGNQNTRMWAQASMSRLTGQKFGTDKKAWAEWWNANGKEPKIDVAALKPWKPIGEKAAAVGAGGTGKVLRFDGVDDYIHIPSTPQLDLTADVTVGAWIKVAPECRGEAVVLFRGDAQIGRDPYGLGVDRGRMRFYVDLLGGQGAETRFAASGDLDGAWHHWVGVRDAAAGRVCLYRDGTLMSEAPAVGKREFDTAGMYNEIGSIDHGRWGPWGFFKGEVDQLSVWNVARTPEEIEREFREGLKGNEAGLVALWTFDEDGQTINDKSPSGITATLGSTPDADANDPARVAAEE